MLENLILAPIWTTNFLFKVSALLDVKHCASCNPVQYQEKLIMQTWENGEKLNFGSQTFLREF